MVSKYFGLPQIGISDLLSIKGSWRFKRTQNPNTLTRKYSIKQTAKLICRTHTQKIVFNKFGILKSLYYICSAITKK